MALLAHGLIPLFLFGALWRGGLRHDRATRIANATTEAAAVLLVAAVGAGWAAFPRFTREAFIAAAITLWVRAVWRARAAEARWPASPWRWARIVVSAAVVACIGGALIAAWTAGRVQGEPVQLAFPLRQAPAYITHGGDSAVTNAHAVVHAQRFALDVVALRGPFRTRARGVLPERLQDYAVFGIPVHAPCSGEVVQARDHLPDQLPPRVDRTHILGNYLAVHCAGVTVLMAHLQSGSVTVAMGDQVKVGQILGRVGNSGNTTEPHLHIHAVRGRVIDPEFLGARGDPVPMVFGHDRAFFVRHDVVAQ